MPWLSPPEQTRPAGNQRRYFRQSVELPISLGVRGLSAPVHATLMNISEGGCRFRSLILLDRERIVEFELRRPGHPPIPLTGRIVSRTMPERGAAYEYGVVFENLSPGRKDELAREIVALQRRAAMTRLEAQRNARITAPSDPRQRRRSVRAMAAFPVRYRYEGHASTPAQACDVSAGGLRLLCSENLPVGTEMELRFTLPSDVLEVYPPPGERVEISPFGPRVVRIPDQRRPFEEMHLRGRIVSVFPPSRGRNVYGIEFLEVDGYTREELARFIHAAQLAKLRSA
jgi:c-di-GMP-binding flagellar brake protein YcgR